MITLLATQAKFRFRLLFENLNETISSLILNFNIDAVNKIISTQVRQTATKGIFNELNKVKQGSSIITLELLDQNQDTTTTIKFVGCKNTKHIINFDYGDAAETIHELEFSFYAMDEM